MTAEPTEGARRPFGVAVAGFGWMGRVHAQAYARVRHHFPGLPLAPIFLIVAVQLIELAAAPRTVVRIERPALEVVAGRRFAVLGLAVLEVGFKLARRPSR